ncbi:LOW QUALITY PROTEIN: BET1 homolog [Dermacentor silvarum]|uniref:LOW QUALITY PROTEIN: BET1 homolog n=1 Tax=Dermacentor silvarum TaxID=543639 RepID=UPI00189AA421|nr:LOW QUALITY PROTEIN: BET1 homolog [Dermacentor silvarum]
MRRAQTSSQGYANGSSYRDTVEEENTQLIDGLKSKISALKTVSIDIGHEVKYQNKMLNEMSTDFEAGEGILKSTMGRLVRMSRSGHNRYIFYLMMFSLFVFLVIYMLIKLG